MNHRPIENPEEPAIAVLLSIKGILGSMVASA